MTEQLRLNPKEPWSQFVEGQTDLVDHMVAIQGTASLEVPYYAQTYLVMLLYLLRLMVLEFFRHGCDIVLQPNILEGFSSIRYSKDTTNTSIHLIRDVRLNVQTKNSLHP